MTLFLSLALIVFGIGATATTADAATVRANPTIQGAGTVSAPGYGCTSFDQSSWNEKTDCWQHVVSNDPSLSGVSTTLAATASSWPAGHWEFVRWDGCESKPEPHLCTVSAPAFQGKNWAPRAVFRDSTAPSISSGPTESYSLSQERTVSFFFGYNEGGTTQCRVDGGGFSACSSGVTRTLAEGDHTFDVRASDASSNWSGNSSRVVKIVDTAIGGGPADSSLTNSRSATFTYSSVAGIAFECRRNSEPFAPCPSGGKTYTGLTDGTHTFQVRAVNGGFFDRIPATRTWRVDGTPPVVGLLPNAATPGEGVLSTLSTAAFSFNANEASTFQCSLDGAAFGSCTSPRSYGGLNTGPHQFKVRAVDSAGNTGAPAERNWSVAVPDSDGDGYNANADCNDGDAGINPGRPELVNNDVDENCDGAKEFDRDNDGSRADRDCDDNNPARTPGKPDVSANGVDEDCDGQDAVRPLDKMSISLASSWKVYKRYTVLKPFTLNGAPLGSKAVISCKGKKCPKKTMTLVTRKTKHGLKGFTGKKLKAGTVITATVSRSGFVTAVKSIKIRSGKKPKVSLQKCMAPGVSTPTPC